MFQFQKIQLTNYIVWDEVELEFEPGRTYIYGDNRSGKSLLFAPLKACLYDTVNIPKGASATLGFSRGEREYEFTALNKGRARNNFHVTINQRDQSVETRDAALALMHKHFGQFVQESVFDTTVSLSGLRKHPLADGKAAQRLDWVHDTLAYASLLDGYVERVEQQIKPARDNSVRYDLLQNQLKALEPVAEVKTDADALAELRTKIESRLTQLNSSIQQIERVIDHRESVPEKPVHTVAQAREAVAEAQERLARLNKQKLRYDLFAQWKPRHDRLQARQQQAHTAYREICEQLGRKPIKPSKALRLAGAALEDAQQQLDRAREQHSVYTEQAELRTLAATPPPLDRPAKAVRVRLENLQEEHSVVKRTIRSVASGASRCELCGSDLSSHTHDPEALATRAAKLKRQIERCELTLQVLAARDTDLVDKPDLAKHKQAVATLTTLVQHAGAVQEADEALAELDAPPEADPVSSKQLDNAAQALETAQTVLADATAYQRATKHAARLEDNPYVNLSLEELQQRQHKLERARRKLIKRQQTVAEKLVAVQTNSVLHARWVDQKQRLETEARDYEQSAQDHRLLLSLRKALGRDGFRTKRLESTLELFVDNLNALAPLVWDEPFKFEIETGPRKCDVIVHRNRMRGDAFSLSGMEQRSWQLVAGLAMLRLLPSNRRCDTIVLDELEANMTTGSRWRYINQFLPELQKTVPNVVVVSPLTTKELHFTPDHAYRVEKRNARSTLRTL